MASVHTLSSALALLALSCLPTGCGTDPEAPDDPAPEGPNVLLISVDTLRADVLGCYGGIPELSPRIDALAAGGVRWSQTFSSTPLTLPAHATMLSGYHPPRHGVRDNALFQLPEEVPTLAELAHEAGWDTAAFVAAFVLDARFGLDQGFAHYDDDIERPASGHAGTVHERGCDEVTRRALEWLEQPRDRPFLAWVHFYDPHFPYEAHPEVDTLRPRTSPPLRGGHYESEVAWVDVHVGKLLDALEDLGQLEDTLVVFTSDHGEALGDHDEPTHGHLVYQSTMDIPLILSHPRLAAGTVVDRAAGLVDVCATVLGFLGLEAPPDGHGRDLVAELGRPDAPTPIAYMESELARISFGFQPIAAASDGRWKYVHAPRPELYDLHADPDEDHNLLVDGDVHPLVDDNIQPAIESLRSAIESLRSTKALDARFSGTDSVRQAVENLGYSVGQAEAVVTRPDWTVTELLEVVQLRDLARGQMTAGRSRDCVATCRSLVEKAPRCSQGWEVGGTALARLEQWEEARTWLENALEIHEALPEAHWNLATTHYRTGNEEKAWAEVERTHELDPEHRGALTLLAKRMEEEDRELAIELYETLERVAGDSPQGHAARKRLVHLRAAQEREDG